MPGSTAVRIHEPSRSRGRVSYESTPDALRTTVDALRLTHADIAERTGLTKDVVRAALRGDRPNFDATEVLLEYLQLDEAALDKELQEALPHQFARVPVRVRRRIIDRALLSVAIYLETGVLPGEPAKEREDRRSTVSKPARGKGGPARIAAGTARGSNSVVRVQPRSPRYNRTPHRRRGPFLPLVLTGAAEDLQAAS